MLLHFVLVAGIVQRVPTGIRGIIVVRAQDHFGRNVAIVHRGIAHIDWVHDGRDLVAKGGLGAGLRGRVRGLLLIVIVHFL